MRIYDSSCNMLSTLEEWERRIWRKRPKHWKKGRSAYSLAEFVLGHDGGRRLEHRVGSLLDKPVTLEIIRPEFLARFDRYRGNPSNLDLGICGRVGDIGSLFVGVEAKVDESFSGIVADEYEEGLKKRSRGENTRKPDRVKDLLSQYFGDNDNPKQSRFAPIRYQLLTATAGIVAQKKDALVFYVLVFRTSKYNEVKGQANWQDYNEFIRCVGGQAISPSPMGVTAHQLTVGGRPLISIYESIPF